MTVRINKQKINLREKLTEFEDKVNATQSLDALVDTSRNIDITNLSTSGESIRNTGAIINNRFVPFGPHARVLDLENTPVSGGGVDPDLKGFNGGFTDGRYGYFVPNRNSNTIYHGKIARVDLHDFSSVDVLDLTSTDSGLKGFYSGFTDGRYGYFVPHYNGAHHGKVARVDLNNFSDVDVLDLTNTDTTLKGFVGGFTDGRYGYFVPFSNDTGLFTGKIARVDLNDFSSVDVLDLTSTDSGLQGFAGGFTDGRYGYFVPNRNSNTIYHGKIARIQLFNGGNY